MVKVALVVSIIALAVCLLTALHGETQDDGTIHATKVLLPR